MRFVFLFYWFVFSPSCVLVHYFSLSVYKSDIKIKLYIFHRYLTVLQYYNNQIHSRVRISRACICNVRCTNIKLIYSAFALALSHFASYHDKATLNMYVCICVVCMLLYAVCPFFCSFHFISFNVWPTHTRHYKSFSHFSVMPILLLIDLHKIMLHARPYSFCFGFIHSRELISEKK